MFPILVSDHESPGRGSRNNSLEIGTQPVATEDGVYRGEGSSGPESRTVRRVLWGKHVFMITFSGILGIGFYTRSGLILTLAGPLGLFLSYLLLTLLAWGVMQCVTEMLSIWPIPSALVEFVRTFVDEDLALAVGVAYWFSYAITFPAFMTAIAGDLTLSKSLDGGIIFTVIPIITVLINSLGVRLYGFIELIGGSVKFLIAIAIILSMCVLNSGAGHRAIEPKELGKHGQFWKGNVTPFDDKAADNWVTAFCISLSLVSFAFVGIEVPAVTALEARVRTPTLGEKGPVDSTVKFSAIWIPVIVGCLYTWGALMISFELPWNSADLPRVSWVPNEIAVPTLAGTLDSAFIIAARESTLAGLDTFITVGLIISALTAANTTLYVASRTLFGLARGVEAGPGSPLIHRFMSFLGQTNHRKVPMRAIVASCCFCWIPFLYLSKSNGSGTAIGTLLEVLEDMGSVACIMVWGVECLAFIRFYYCVKRHQKELVRRNIRYLKRFRFDEKDDYPYRSHGQPITAYLSLLGCLFLVTVANGASVWKKFRTQPFLSAYLSDQPVCFPGLWACIKAYRGKNPWGLVKLDNPDEVIEKMERLDRLRWRSTANDEEPNAWYNLWGIFERLDKRNIRL